MERKINIIEFDPNGQRRLADFALDCGRRARIIARRRMGNAYTKSDDTDLTDADLEIQDMFIDRVQTLSSRHSVIGEEASHEVSHPELIWRNDPIDGTTAYKLGVAASMFAAACISGTTGEVLAAVACNLDTDDDYWATRLGASYKNDQPIHVSNATPETGLTIGGTGSGVGREVLASDTYYYVRGQTRRRMSVIPTTFKACQVAEGIIDAASYKGTHPHDVVAGALLVAQAGGQGTDIRGNQLQTLKGKVNGAIFSNGAPGTHDFMIEELANVIARH